MLVPYARFLKKVQVGRWAIPTFNTFNIEITQALIKAATVDRSPMVMEISKRSLEHAGGPPFLDYISSMVERAPIPVALHFDHGETLGDLTEAIKLPFSSVMIGYDVTKNLAENIRITKKVVALAGRRKISVQGEVGKVTGPKYNWRMPQSWLTKPADATRYVEETGVSSLAVSVKNRHGIAAGSVEIDYDLLSQIRAVVDVPLVLHGGSGLRKAGYPIAIRRGISFVNFDTDLRFAYTSRLKRGLQKQSDLIDPRPALKAARVAVVRVARQKIKACNAIGKAARI